jgi:hypothetical protein
VDDQLFKSHDFSGLDDDEIQSRFWELQEVLHEIEENKLFQVARSSSADLKVFLDNYMMIKTDPDRFVDVSRESLTDWDADYRLNTEKINLIAKTLNIPENLSIPNKVKTIAEAYREIDKVVTHYNATGTLLTNRYITSIAKRSNENTSAAIVTIGGKKQIWEFRKSDYNDSYTSYRIEIPADNISDAATLNQFLDDYTIIKREPNRFIERDEKSLTDWDADYRLNTEKINLIAKTLNIPENLSIPNKLKRLLKLIGK